jgi:hypothetical protein
MCNTHATCHQFATVASESHGRLMRAMKTLALDPSTFPTPDVGVLT